jgi:hypothetical protein
MTRIIAMAATCATLLTACAGTGPAPQAQTMNALMAAQLDDFARRLSDTGNAARGKEISDEAVRLRQAEVAVERGDSSTYLGFMPDQSLHEYAAFLRRSGAADSATKADTLANAYRDIQNRAVLEQFQRLKPPEPAEQTGY